MFKEESVGLRGGEPGKVKGVGVREIGEDIEERDGRVGD